METKNYYDILQVSPSACNEVIEAAYKARQKQCHPDLGGSDDLARALNEAKQVLLDAEARRDYDAAEHTTSEPAGSREGPLLGREGGSVVERTYVVCLHCRTRNLVEYHHIEVSSCFECQSVFGREHGQGVMPSALPESPQKKGEPPQRLHALGMWDWTVLAIVAVAIAGGFWFLHGAITSIPVGGL